MNYLFVYGTLLSGFDNPYSQLLHQKARLVESGFFCGKLYDLGQYPTAIYDPKADTLVLGEIWQLPDFEFIIKKLDEYEGIFDDKPEYVSQQIDITAVSGQTYCCWVYLSCVITDSFVQILSGDYKKWIGA
jgi:gamma-glutamylcyclotransferase (GGCT)/AIG2-like uncharacterized protein YtfP